ncbi:MAG TPA: ribonuclease HII [Thermoplasmata archaeon]|nr:ribonuclease HII [Thermoplasmata archaeon]
MLGLDEAGRGSVLGPLVIGGFCLPEDGIAGLAAAGVRDSKALTPRARAVVYRRLAGLGSLHSVALRPATIDRWVRHHGLNELELATFARLVRAVRPAVAVVDACDPNAGRFERRLSALVGGEVEIVARHRADATEPVVGAASIVAKVRRDRAVAALRRRLGEGVGSGYPSDPTTCAFVEAAVRAGRPLPRWLRASWAPVQRVKRARSAPTLDSFGP